MSITVMYELIINESFTGWYMSETDCYKFYKDFCKDIDIVNEYKFWKIYLVESRWFNIGDDSGARFIDDVRS